MILKAQCCHLCVSDTVFAWCCIYTLWLLIIRLWYSLFYTQSQQFVDLIRVTFWVNLKLLQTYGKPIHDMLHANFAPQVYAIWVRNMAFITLRDIISNWKLLWCVNDIWVLRPRIQSKLHCLFLNTNFGSHTATILNVTETWHIFHSNKSACNW